MLVTLASVSVAACTRGGPACDGSGSGGGARYCLIANQVLRVSGGATLPLGQAAMVAVDDNTAAVLVRDDAGLYALSGICTHACCVLTLCTDASCIAPRAFPTSCAPAEQSPILGTGAALLCPCHGSTFDAHGAVTGGPASTDLPTFAVEIDGPDALIDCSRVVPTSTRV